MRCNATGYCALVLFALAALAWGQGAAGSLRGKHVVEGASLSSDATIVREAQEALDRVSTPDGPGAAVLIARGDKVIYRSARGRAEIELGVPLSPDNVFRIASVTKMFTAAMILKLAEAGKLSLDDPLTLYLPDFPNGGGITIRELLNHTAGISEVAKDPQPGFSRRDVTTAMQVAEISKRPLDFAPGTGWSYSNAGFILLGAVIEKITGESWHAAIAKQILEPLRMKHTLYGDNSVILPGRTAGYTTDNPNHAVENAPFISITIPGAAGGLVSTVDDLRIWIRALSTGQVVSKTDFQQMITPGPKLPGTRTMYGYGFGTFVFHVRGNTMIGHTGQIPGFASVVGYLPERDITVIALGNDDNFDAQTMGRRLAAIALGQPYSEPVAAQSSEEELRALAGTYRIDENTIETLSLRDNKLYAQRGSRNAIPLQMTADKQLHFVPDELSYFMPVRDASGRTTGLNYFENGDGPPKLLPRN